ncbi:MAG: lysylphosphatidylglycerol synthase transmembrane domain-containing protein [Vicingaceae bacterium]
MRRIGLAVIFGLLGASYLLWRNFDAQAFEHVNWSYSSFFWLFIALSMMAIRDLAYMYRIRVLTDNRISWRNSFDVIMLWEFASALTPSVVGGSSVALYIVHKEGISLGKSTAVVMTTALLDELFYVIMVPVLILFVGLSDLFPISLEKSLFGFRLGTIGLFVAGYAFILILIVVIAYAIFINPRGLKAGLLFIFKWKWLRRWRYAAIRVGNDIMITSKELKGKDNLFWIKAFGATFFSWTARYWVVNFMILAFLPVSDHLLIYARQLVMWVILLISPTPGGSGVAEFAFSGFLGEFTLGLAATFALLWRLISYYPYIFIGSVVLPNWIKRVFAKKRKAIVTDP